MRISDWSSDVCSSDLVRYRQRHFCCPCVLCGRWSPICYGAQRLGNDDLIGPWTLFLGEGWCPRRRSEEHTSELQSLMRISYAVFCLNIQKLGKQTSEYKALRRISYSVLCFKTT